ncbi:ligand-binding sensor domain-containing protein [Pedobacter sp. UYEF25]
MRIKSASQHSFSLYLTFLTVLTISCNNQSQSNKLVAFKNNMQTVSTVKLKYTSGIRSLLEDGKGNIWFGSYNEGVCLLHDGKLKYFTTKNGLSHNQVRSIYEDKNGIVWFECGVGLSTYNGQQMTIYKQRDYESRAKWKLIEHDLWFKGNEIEGYNKTEGNAGVYQYDGKTLLYRTLPVPPYSEKRFNFNNSISTSFVKGKNGTLWLGAYGVVIGYNGSNFKIIDNKYLAQNKLSPHLHVRSIMEDRKGNLWIGNNGLGVLKYDGKKIINFTEQHKLNKENTKGNALKKVFSVGEDRVGNIWFGTVGSGVWRYDGNSVKNFAKEDGLESKNIWFIYQSKHGGLWFGGGNPSGVYQFNGRSFERKY